MRAFNRAEVHLELLTGTRLSSFNEFIEVPFHWHTSPHNYTWVNYSSGNLMPFFPYFNRNRTFMLKAVLTYPLIQELIQQWLQTLPYKTPTFPLGGAQWSRRREVLLRLLPVFPHYHRTFLLALRHFQRFKLLGVLGAFVVGQRLALRKKQNQEMETKSVSIINLWQRNWEPQTNCKSHGWKCGHGHIRIQSKEANKIHLPGGTAGPRMAGSPLRAWMSF